LVSHLFYKIEEYIWQYRVIPVLLYSWLMYDKVVEVAEPKQNKWTGKLRWFTIFMIINGTLITMQLGNYYAGRMVVVKVIPFKENPSEYQKYLALVMQNDKYLALF